MQSCFSYSQHLKSLTVTLHTDHSTKELVRILILWVGGHHVQGEGRGKWWTVMITYINNENSTTYIFNSFLSYFYFTLLYNTVLGLPYIDMNPPQVYMSSQTWTPPPHLPPHIISLCHPHAPAPSILYPASSIDWHFVSFMIVYMFQCHSPKSSHALPLPQSPKVRSIHLCLFCCLTYRVIITIFLNSVYMCQYTVLVLFFLAYFTLYNQLQFHPSH